MPGVPCWHGAVYPAKKASDPEADPRLRVNFGAYAAAFLELVTEDGEGWLILHVAQIVAFVEANPSAVRKGIPEELCLLLYRFYLINRRDNGDYVLLPQRNVNN